MSSIRKRKPTSTVLSLRVSAGQAQRLRNKARQLGRTPSDTGALLLEEALRRAEFAFIDFRDSAVGRQPYIMGTRLAVWQVMAIVNTVGGDLRKAAAHLGWPLMKVQASVNYAKAFADDLAELKATASDDEELKRILPQLETFTAPKTVGRSK